MGVVARWEAASASLEDPALVGVPGMNAPIRAMAEPLGVDWSVRAERLYREGANWRIESDCGVYAAPLVVLAIPAEQAAALLAQAAPQLAAIPAQVVSQPCWAVMASFAEPLGIFVDTVRADNDAIAWAARNSAKPGRSGPESWVIHASPARSRELLECAKDEIGLTLLTDFAKQTGLDFPEPLHLSAHRWLYALPAALPGEPWRYDAAAGIGLAGDYLHSPRVEGAWLSGKALAREILRTG
jgi:predicted NAD/FAD-dependent oxidoreductase